MYFNNHQIKFENLLKRYQYVSNFSSNQNNLKYICLFLKSFNLRNDKDLFEKRRDINKTLIFYAFKSGRIENFISFLMPDWYQPGANNNLTYDLVLKSKQFESEKNVKFLAYLYSIIDDPNNLVYQDVYLRIIYQFLMEAKKEEDLQNILCIEQVFSMRNEEFKLNILKIIVVFWKTKDEVEEKAFRDKVRSVPQSEIDSSFFVLAFWLKDEYVIDFQRDFKKSIEVGKSYFGDFYKVALKPYVRLLLAIVMEQDMLKTEEFLFTAFPFVGVNFTIMKSFNDNKMFSSFIIHPFRNAELNTMVE